MKPSTLKADGSHPNACQYALRRGIQYWVLVFAGREAIFKDELGARYVAYLLRERPLEPIHGVALALKARESLGQPASPGEVLEQRAMGLEDAASVRALWRRQRELERVLADRHEIAPVKAEALRQLEEVTEFLRKSPWLSHHGAERCARAVAAAIKRLHVHLAVAVDAEGRPDEVLRAFALHLHEYLLVPSGRGAAYARTQANSGFAGCFIYTPPEGVGWEVQSPESKVQGPESKVLGPESKVQGPESKVQDPESKVQRPESGVQGPESKVRAPSGSRPAAVGYLSRFLCVGYAAALMATGCAGPRPLKGGRAGTTGKPAGVVEQTLVQSDNPAQAAKQDQESVKVRTYTVPAGSRVEQLNAECGVRSAEGRKAEALNANAQPSTSFAASRQPSTLNAQPSTTFTLSAPMPVVEREETRARTELGAAQKDTARELGAKLASLKGIVWVGVGLFVFGLGSLVWPPLKAVIGSVTTSIALMGGGVALMVVPSLVVGNELLILGGVGVAIGGWFLAHRHGQLRGVVAANSGSQSKVQGPKSTV